MDIYNITQKISKNLFKGKKAQQHIWAILMAAVIAFVAAFFLILWFKGAGEKSFDSVNNTLDSLGDCDKDGIANFYDKCPCAAGENEEFKGCPSEVESKEDLSKYTSCEGFQCLE